MSGTTLEELNVHTHNDHDCGCGCGGSGGCGCGCPPAEFTRLRYAYGLHLGAVELSDEQRYLTGKQRFHNVRLHGSGVICGLQAQRFEPVVSVIPGHGRSTTVLRVTRGAALDHCGHEVLVSVDQCIDVAAWFARNRAKVQLAAGQRRFKAWVALRYRECPSDPAAVPRDPCGCDDGGCTYSRVRESFELALLPAPPQCLPGPWPSTDTLRSELLQPTDSNVTFESIIVKLTSAACPTSPEDAWICLATVEVVLDDQNGTLVVTDIEPPDNAIPGRRVLLSTSAIQGLLGLALRGTQPPSTTANEPTISGVGFTGDSDHSGMLQLNIDLAADPASGADVELVKGSLDIKAFALALFDASLTNPWVTVHPANGLAYIPSAQPSPARIDLRWNDGLKAGRYRLSYTPGNVKPGVDALMRQLRPAPHSHNFRLATDATTGNLVLADPLF